jgi:hypothetical protein
MSMPLATDVAAEPNGFAAAADAEATVLTWRVHRLREELRFVPLVAGAYAAALTLWWLAFPHPVALLLPLVSLTGALSDYLFPTTYRLTTRGAHADCGVSRLFVAWADVKRATHGGEGVYLSPLARPSRLDAFRGVRLRYADGNDDAVRETVRRLWRGPEGSDR